MIIEFRGEMSKIFEMSDLGLSTYYLGIEVLQHKEGITLRQERYARRILQGMGMEECNAVIHRWMQVLFLRKCKKRMM